MNQDLSCNKNKAQNRKPDAEQNGDSLFTRKDIYDILQIFFQSVIIITLLFVFVFRFSVVNGDSMNPTLQTKDWLILSNIGFEPKRGDIVVVSQPNFLDEVLIKRIIALPGETVDITQDGYVTINGKMLHEPYTASVIIDRGNISFPHTVQEGHVFIMGDNRNHSSDSRYQGVGDIDIRYIVGEAKFRLFPLGQNNIYKNIDYQLDDSSRNAGE